MEDTSVGKDETKMDHLEEEDHAGVDFCGATLAIHSDVDVSLYSPTVDDNGATINNEDAPNESTDETAYFFATRTGAFENAVSACHPVMLPNIDGSFHGAWLLTEIDHWDAEKERLVLLTQFSLLIIKYDFIALKVLDYKRLSLSDFDRIVIGNFSYPEASVVPKMGRMVNLVKGLVFNWTSNRSRKPPAVPKSGALCVHNVSKRRSSKGIRAMWNKGKSVDTKEIWNPWSRAIPYVTLTSHPSALLAPNNGSAMSFDVDNFQASLLRTISQLPDGISKCVVEEKPILIESYVGVLSLLHNENNLGFFKLRGKVSF